MKNDFFSQGSQALDREQKLMLIKQDQRISIRRKCKLLGLNRSGLYCVKKDNATTNDIDLMLQFPFFGYRKVNAVWQRNGCSHNRKKTQRLMRLAGLKAICPFEKGVPHRKRLLRAYKSVRQRYLESSKGTKVGNKQAQQKATYRRHIASAQPKKMTLELIQFMERMLCDRQWSPEQISGYLRQKKSTYISHERTNQYI